MFKHSKGILTLASTEMWERFSFYTMQYSLVLYATATLAKGGLGFNDSKALQIVGIYGGLAYATPLLGGYIADKWVGRRNAIHLGGILMAIGHFILAFGGIYNFYASLIFIAIGCGLFKPNITSLVGNLYSKHDEKREAGYNIFYAGINVGALLSGIIGGILNDSFGYYASFGAAGICMVVGVINFKFFSKSIRHLGTRPAKNIDLQSHEIKTTPFFQLSPSARNGVYLFLFLSVMNIIWQIAYAQWAGSLNLLAERNTDRVAFGYTIPTLWFESLNSFFIVIISPVLAIFYTWLQKNKKKIDLSHKLSLGYFLQALACFIIIPAVIHVQSNPNFQASPWYQFFFYLSSTVAELFTVPVMFAATSILAPKGYEGRLMGIYIFTALSMGTYLAGETASLFTQLGDTKLFLCLGIVTFVFGVIHILINKKINKYEFAAIQHEHS
jgi:POT family proton-dependent oligopeptide transporter